MSDLSPPSDESVPLSQLRRVDQACWRFEAAWKAGERPSIEDFLRGWDEPGRAALTHELVLLEIHYRRGRGDACAADDYYARFPTLDRDALADDAPPAAAGETLTISPVETPPAAAPPQSFGDYDLLEELGRGGMGVVYKARQKSLNRVVALKMILTGEHAGAQERERFHREALAIARLQHPNIVQVHEIGEHQGRPFFSLEFCPGGGLDKKLNGTPLSPQEAARLIEVLARTIHYAHQQNVVHRDLKPANVLLSADGTAKVTDFGLAKQLDDVGGTQSGAILGTPSYMAPEQAAGKQHEVGRPTDVYALGAVLYECITGRPPFKAATPFDTLRQVLADDPVAPRQLQPRTPRDLETICLQSLRKEPKSRYADAQALAEDLRCFQAGKPVTARRIGALGRLRLWRRRNPALAALTACLLLVLLTVAAGSTATALYLDATLATSEKNRKQAEDADLQGKFKLWVADLDHADARRMSRQSGQRFAALLAIQDALTLPTPLDHSTDELRTEAIAACCLPDIEVEKEWDGWPEGSINVTFDPSFERYARGDMEGYVHVHRVSDGAELFPPLPPAPGTQHGDYACAAEFSPDGRLLNQYCARSPTDSNWPHSRLWRVDGPEAVLVLDDDHLNHAFSPDGSRFAAYYPDGTIRVYNAASGASPLPVLRRYPTNLLRAQLRLAWLPTGARLGYADGDMLHVLDLDTGGTSEIQGLIPPGGAFRVCWSPDGREIAVSGNDNLIRLWDAETHQLLAPPLASPDAAQPMMQFSPSGDRLLSTGWDGVWRLWEARTGRPLLSLQASWKTLQFSRDGRRLTAVPVGHKLRMFRYAEGTEFRGFQDLANVCTPHGASNLAALDPSGRLLAVRTAEGVAFVDLEREARVGLIPSPRTCIIAFESGGSLLTQGPEGVLRWPVANDAAGGRRTFGPPQRLSAVSGATEGTSSSRDGQVVAACVYAGSNGALLLHPARGDSCILGPQQDVRFCSVSPDGRWVATGSFTLDKGNGVKIWDGETGRFIRDLPIGGSGVSFSPDGRWLFTNGREPRLWKVDGWEQGPDLHGDPLNGYGAFSADGQLLALGDAPGVVRLLETRTGRELARLTAPTDVRLRPAAFTADGARLIVYSIPDATLYLFDLRALRADLAGLGLDWDAPAYAPPAAVGDSAVTTVQVDLGDIMDPQRYDQYLAQGREDAANCRWDAAVEEFSRAINIRSNDPSAWWQRARVHGRLGHWDEAKSDDARAVALFPMRMPAIWYDYAGACVQAGDLPSCRQVCRRLLNQPEPANPDDCYWVAHACILAPDTVTDWQQPLHLAAKAAAEAATPWRIYVLAAASYRAGHYGETVCLCGQSMQAGPWQSVCLDYLLLAMAHHHLRDDEVARAWLEKANAEIEAAEKVRRGQSSNVPIAAFTHYCDWLDFQILRREAEALLAGK